MGLLQDKFAKYDLPQQFMAKGVYPYFRTINSHQDTEVTMDGKKVLMFGSNAYMGLTYDKRIIDASIAATEKYGTGCAGSRFLNGTLDIHVELEKELAEFVGKDEALCFSTGFTVNEGIIPAVVGRGDYIICDDRDHASIVDGRRLSFATQLKYKHNDMEDLEKELQKCEPDAVKLIVVDGVFSMEGDLANLPEIVRLKKKYNASIYVDEAPQDQGGSRKGGDQGNKIGHDVAAHVRRLQLDYGEAESYGSRNGAVNQLPFHPPACLFRFVFQHVADVFLQPGPELCRQRRGFLGESGFDVVNIDGGYIYF